MKKFFSTAFGAILLTALINTAYGQKTIFIPADGTGVSSVAGKIGIGISNPAEKLDVNGNINLRGNIKLSSGDRTIEVGSGSSLYIKRATNNLMKFDNLGKTFFYGNVYLPQTSSLVIGLDNANDGVNSLKISYSTTHNHAFMNYKDNLVFRTGALTYSPLTMQGNGSIAVGYPLNYLNDGTQYQTKGYKFAVNGTALFEDNVTFNNNVGIGTNALSQYKLAVNGKIIATEIIVKEYGNGWPDYVFANNYNLRSLDEVESFIGENGHLPEVPSAKVVEETGVGVGEMNAILLKKVEELTLYAIQQGKLIKALEEKLEKLEATK